MTKEDITLSAKKRVLTGKKVKQLRDAGLTPAVIHEKNKDSVDIEVDAAHLKKVFAAAGKHHAVQLDLEGKKYTTIIKELISGPASHIYYHAVFQAIKADEKVTAELPVKLSEDIPAERASLLVLKKLDHLLVEALPKDLIDSVEVDASGLVQAGDKLQVSDIKLSSAITIKTDPETVIATVEVPKDQIAEADAALEEQAEAEVKTAEQSAEATADAESSSEKSDS